MVPVSFGTTELLLRSDRAVYWPRERTLFVADLHLEKASFFASHGQHLPPYDSRERALEVLSELQSRGVDSFIVKAGEDANAISLGYFTSEESAEGLRVKMHNAGYPAFVRETSRPVTEYWLYMPERADGAAALEDFLVGNPAVSRDRVACRTPARQNG